MTTNLPTLSGYWARWQAFFAMCRRIGFSSPTEIRFSPLDRFQQEEPATYVDLTIRIFEKDLEDEHLETRLKRVRTALEEDL